jgi:uncharacterized oligopeptide transporter (OPT) family protein
MADSKAIYTPQPGERQLTARALIAGCLLGSVVSCTNIYTGLKIGWAFGASIITAVLSYSAFAMFNRRLSVLETGIAQTAGSAAGYMSSAAGLLAAIPAMMLLGHEFSFGLLILWALGVAFLGVFFAIPLRRQYVEVEQLRFPTGTAAAETIVAMQSESEDALAKSRLLLIAGLAAGAYTLVSYFFPELKEIPLTTWFSWGALGTAAAWGFHISVSPALMGAGLLIGPRVVWSLVGGSVLGWAVLGPFAQGQGWAPGKAMDIATGPRGWILWPGVAVLVSESLMVLLLSWKTIVRTFTTRATLESGGEQDGESIPTSWWVGGLLAGSLWTMLLAQIVFDIPWYLTLVAIPLSAVLATVGVRSLGETDINPVGGLGKVTQLVFGGLAPGQMATNLMSAAITSGGASQAADMMQDLKTGYLLGSSPRKMFFAQLTGICAGVLLVVPVYTLFTRAHPLGGEEFPAPSAFAWKAMAELLAEGLDALPPHASTAVACACCCGALLACLRRVPTIKAYVPSGLALGLGFLTFPDQSICMFLGLVIWYLWRTANPTAVEKLSFSLASGMIAGEGLMGIVNAVMTIAGVPSVTGH